MNLYISIESNNYQGNKYGQKLHSGKI